MNTYLDKAILGEYYVINSVCIIDAQLCIRIEELGFVKGVKVRVMSYTMRKRTLLVAILGSMFAIKASVASGIMVTKA